MPMPVDVELTYKDGSKELHNLPLNLMFGAKQQEDPNIPQIQHEPWLWTRTTYVFSSDKKITDIAEVNIDPSKRLADVDRRNNTLKLNW